MLGSKCHWGRNVTKCHQNVGVETCWGRKGTEPSLGVTRLRKPINHGDYWVIRRYVTLVYPDTDQTGCFFTFPLCRGGSNFLRGENLGGRSISYANEASTVAPSPAAIESAVCRGENPPRVAGENHRSRWNFTLPVKGCFMHKRIDLRVFCHFIM